MTDVLQETPDEVELGKSVISVSKDRITVVFDLAGQEYTATKPKKVEEWFVELQLALSSDDEAQLLTEADRFFRKVIGEDSYKAIKMRRLDDEDELTFTKMIESMYDLFEIWSTEPDQPVRPTGPRSGSGRGKARTTRK